MEPTKVTLPIPTSASSATDRSARPDPHAPSRPAADWIRVVKGRWRWRIHPDWLDLLDGPDAPDWADLEDHPCATRVKVNDGREVWRYASGGDLLFVKVARPGRKWPRLRRLLRGCPADQEYRIAAYALEHGIDTVQPIAIAEAPRRSREPTSIFVTSGLPGAVALNVYWSAMEPANPQTRRLRNAVIDTTARLIAWAHQNGFVHLDLHAGNMLIQPTEDGVRAVFVDLHNVRVGRRVPERLVVRNLAQFNQWFRWNANLADRVRFLDRYLYWHHRFETVGAHAITLRSDRRQLIAKIERAAYQHANTLYAKRDRRAMRSGRYFARLTLSGGWHAHVFLATKHPIPGSIASRMQFTPSQWKAWLARPEDWFTPDDRSKVIKDSRTAMVCRKRLTIGENRTLETVCKRSLPRTLRKRLQSLVRTSRPMLTWQRANALLHRQIPTARPLAVVERHRFGLLTDSFIVTEYLEHALDLDTLLTLRLRDVSPALQRRVKDAIIRDLAAVLRRLHERGFTHRDLKAPNVMVQWSPEEIEPPRVLLVDLDGLKRVRRVSARKQIRALTRLNISLDHCTRATMTDRIRFLKYYLRRLGNPDPDWKPLWREIAAHSKRQQRRRRQRQRKLLEKYGRF